MVFPATVLITPTGEIQGAGPPPLTGVPALFTSTSAGPVQTAPQIVPVRPLVSQILTTTLNGQATTLKLYFKQIQAPVVTGLPSEPPAFEDFNPLFCDVYLTQNNQTNLVIGGVLCQDRNRIIRDTYLGYSGDLAFIDTQGRDDPTPNGLGSRFVLTYWPGLA